MAFGGDASPGCSPLPHGLGQIIRPPMVAWTLHRAATPSQGFTQGWWRLRRPWCWERRYAVMVWRWPLRAPLSLWGGLCCQRQRQAQHKVAPPPAWSSQLRCRCAARR